MWVVCKDLVILARNSFVTTHKSRAPEFTLVENEYRTSWPWIMVTDDELRC